MSIIDLLLATLALGVAIFLARGSHPLVGVLLVVSALGISAILFLPTPLLGEWVGMDRVHRLYGLTRATPLDPPEWIHLFAFVWLGALIWFAREDVRNWRGVSLVIALCIGAEVSQWLTDGRQPRLEDAALNVLGGVAGMLLAHAAGRARIAGGRS